MALHGSIDKQESLTSAIDAHCHLSLLPPETLDNYIQVGVSLGIERWIMAGYDASDWQKQLSIKQKYTNRVSCCFGIHPWHVIELSNEAWQQQWLILESMSTSAQIIGETGLDFFKVGGEGKKDQQIFSFKKHIELSLALKKPLMLHIVRAHGEALEILRQFDWRQIGGIVHAFSGSIEVAQAYCRLGFVVSIGPQILNSRFKKLRQTAVELKPDQFVIETDNPWEGNSPNQPGLLLSVADALAQLRQTTVAGIIHQSTQNLSQKVSVTFSPKN